MQKAPNVSLRLDLDLYAKLYDRHKISGRSLNKEIIHLIQWALDEQVKRDQELREFMQSRRSRTLQSQTESGEHLSEGSVGHEPRPSPA